MSFIVVTIIMILLATVFLNIPLTIGFASSKGVTKASVFVPMTELIIAGLYAIIVYKFFHISMKFCSNNLKMIFTLGWPLLLIGIANATQYPDIWKALRELPVGQIIGMALVSIFSSLLIGFSEEIFFRGGVYNFTKRLFKKETVKKSVFLNSVLFGLIHAVNYFNGG